MAEVVALGVTESAVCYARFRVKGGQFLCTGYGVQAVEGDWAQGAEAAVGAVLDRCGDGVSYGVCIPAERTHLRELQFPFADKKQIAQAVPFSIEEFLPGATEEFTNTHQVTAADASGVKVWALSVPTAFLRGLFAAFRQRKLFPDWVTTDLVAAAHIVPAGTPLVVADCKDARVQFTVFDGGRFAGGRSFRYDKTAFAADCHRSLAALNATGTAVGFTAAAARRMTEAGITEFPQAKLLQLPAVGASESAEAPELTAALWGVARAILEERDCELNLCTGEFAQPAIWQKLATPLLFFMLLLCAAAGLGFGHLYRQNKTLQRAADELVGKREKLFRQMLPKASLPRYADEQEAMLRNYVRKYTESKAGAQSDQQSALMTWLRYYAALPINKASPNWWMLQLDARGDELAMTVRAESFQIGMALLDSSLKSGEYESKLDDLHKDDKSVTFVLRSKLRKTK